MALGMTRYSPPDDHSGAATSWVKPGVGPVPEWKHRFPGNDRVYGLQDWSAAAPGLMVARACPSTSIRLGERQPYLRTESTRETDNRI